MVVLSIFSGIFFCMSTIKNFIFCDIQLSLKYIHWSDRNAVLASRQCLLHIKNQIGYYQGFLQVKPKTIKLIFVASLLSTQHYGLRAKTVFAFFLFIYIFCTCLKAKFRKNCLFIQTNSYIIFTCPNPVLLVPGFG